MQVFWCRYFFFQIQTHPVFHHSVVSVFAPMDWVRSIIDKHSIKQYILSSNNKFFLRSIYRAFKLLSPPPLPPHAKLQEWSQTFYISERKFIFNLIATITTFWRRFAIFSSLKCVFPNMGFRNLSRLQKTWTRNCRSCPQKTWTGHNFTVIRISIISYEFLLNNLYRTYSPTPSLDRIMLFWLPV